MLCPICKKEFNEHTGRRPKKFCSDACKVKFWNVSKKVKVNNKPENKQRILEERNPKEVKVRDFNSQPQTNYSINTTPSRTFDEFLLTAKQGFLGEEDEQRFRKELMESKLSPNQRGLVFRKISRHW